jgi:hypothetical protein
MRHRAIAQSIKHIAYCARAGSTTAGQPSLNPAQRTSTKGRPKTACVTHVALAGAAKMYAAGGGSGGERAGVPDPAPDGKGLQGNTTLAVIVQTVRYVQPGRCHPLRYPGPRRELLTSFLVRCLRKPLSLPALACMEILSQK